MKRKLFIILCLIAFSLFVATMVFAFSTKQYIANEVDYAIIIDEEDYNFTGPIVTINDKTYLPVREFANALGYRVDWNEERREVSIMDQRDCFIDDVYTTREGVLKNGRKYKFYGTDKQKFNIQNYLNQESLIKFSSCDIKIQEESIEAIIEKVQVLLGIEKLSSKTVGIIVYYDPETHSLLCMEDFYGVPQPGGRSVIVINCENGETTRYSDGLV